MEIDRVDPGRLDRARRVVADAAGPADRLHVMAQAVLFTDDTPVRTLAPGTGKTSWRGSGSTAVDQRPHAGTAPPAAFYRYTPDRRGEHPRAHLAGFSGVLQADGYAGFNGLYDDSAVSHEAACWAHVRRKFHDIHAAGQARRSRRRR